MKKIKIFLFSVLVMAAFPACNDYLDLYPDNAQTSDQYWNSKGDVEKVVAAGYVKLRESVGDIFMWGEARGTGLNFYNTSEDIPKAATEIRNLQMRNSNTYCKWGSMYKVINMANSVLKFAPEVMEKDPSFTREEMNGYFSEAYFQRALAYFYLIRTFKDVPFIKEPYVNDDLSFDFPQSTEEEILSDLKDDLVNKALPSAKEYYPEINDAFPLNTKGRATVWSIYALLADIYLWEGDYDNCIKYCTYLIESGRHGLIGKDKWFQNFYPGNSNESIFEIQYDNVRGQTNKFLEWFDSKFYYGVSLQTRMFLDNTTMLGDVRGSGGTYFFYGLNPAVWKYLGKDFYSVIQGQRSTSTENDQNFIIYRLAEIYLMRAEAYIMKGQDTYQDAIEDIGAVRSRAGIEEVLATKSSEREMLIFLLDERQREFCAEAKSWFDLLRVAKRNNYEYLEFMISEVINTVAPGNYDIVRSKLMNVGSHYLPIHVDEMQANKLLKQNSYYENLGY